MVMIHVTINPRSTLVWGPSGAGAFLQYFYNDSYKLKMGLYGFSAKFMP